MRNRYDALQLFLSSLRLEPDPLQAAYAKLEEMKSNSAAEVESAQQQSTAQLTAMSRCETQHAVGAVVAHELLQGARAVQA